ncbi:MAG: Hsp70 family protein [Pirellulaceae bacterium]
MHENAVAIGIDLGTTNSAVAYVAASGRTVMIGNSAGDTLTPSVVYFAEDAIVVGKEARKAMRYDSDRVARDAKRDIGKKHYRRPIAGRMLPPQVISACILGQLKKDIRREIASPLGIVLTVPAYFDERRREATMDAAKLADLPLLDMINEPVAASLSFAEHLGYLDEMNRPAECRNLLVYDLGGGTFDVSVISLGPDVATTVSTDGDMQLGGIDWTQRIFDHVLERWAEAQQHRPTLTDDQLARLWDQVEECKLTLSARESVTLDFEFSNEPLRLVITRSDFHDWTADLLERTVLTARQALAAAGMTWADISHILLIGGATRMVRIAQRLEEVTGIAPEQVVNPDEAVARGAALVAESLLSRQTAGRRPRFQVVQVNAHSLGVEGVEPTTNQRRNITIIPKNSPLPTQRVHRFVTLRDRQTSVVVNVLEGDNPDPQHCQLIGRVVLKDLPADLAAGTPVEVSYHYAANGKLEVRATLPETTLEVVAQFQREGGLDAETSQYWRDMIGP